MQIVNTHKQSRRHNSSSSWSNHATYASTYDHHLSQAAPLFADAYTDPKFFQLEVDRIFKREWIAVAHVSQFDGQPGAKVVPIGDDSLVVTRDKEGEFHAFYNVCPHRSACLFATDRWTETIDDMSNGKPIKQITCPYHWWSFRLNGQIKSMSNLPRDDPIYQLKESDPDSVSMRRVPHLDVFCGIIFVNLCADHERLDPVSTQYGDMQTRFGQYNLDTLSCVGEINFRLNSNWKIVQENFLEWYHLPCVHKVLTSNSSVDDHMISQGEGRYACYLSSPVTPSNTMVDLDQFNFIPGLSSYNQKTMYMISMYPNVMAFLHPTHVYIQINYPTSVGETLQKFLLMMPDATVSKLDGDSSDVFESKKKKLGEYWVKVNNEDVEIVERVQRGMNSDGTRTEFGNGKFTRYEYCSHRFQKFLIDSLTSDCAPARLHFDIENDEFVRDSVESIRLGVANG